MKSIARNSSLRLLTAAAISTALAFAATGCKHDNNQAPLASNAAAADPASANLAQPTAVLGQSETNPSQQQAEDYNNNPAYDQGQNNGEAQGAPVYEQASAPPPLRNTEQPQSPGDGYIWTPGYWGNGPSGYVWVNGAWARPPYTGALWTPPYWGYTNNRYRFHNGYWGRHVGFYGGVDYGYGYIGSGYYGGYWNGPHFYYNREVNHLGGGIGFTYDHPVFYNGIHYGFAPHSFVSYNGGVGGIGYRPQGYELSAMREEHRPAFGVQIDNFHSAGGGYARGDAQPGFDRHDQGIHVEERGGGHMDNGFHGGHNDPAAVHGDFRPNGGGHGDDHGHPDDHGHH